MYSELEKKLIVEFSKYLGIEESKVKLDSDLEVDFELDSTEFVCLLVCIEKSFGISLADVKMSAIQRVRDLSLVLEARVFE